MTQSTGPSIPATCPSGNCASGSWRPSGTSRTRALSLQIISFGYKFGVPLEADLVFDVRFMENPFYRRSCDPVRAHRTGAGLRARSADHAAIPRFQRDGLLAIPVPAYLAEGKTRLTVAIGCTGGFHRSVAIGEAVAADLTEMHRGPVMVWHRELEKHR